MAAVTAAAPTRLHPPPPSLFLIPNQPPKLTSTSFPLFPSRFFSYSLPAIKASLQVEQPTQELKEEPEIEDDNLDDENEDEIKEEGGTEDGKLDTNDAARMNLDPPTVLKRTRVDPVNLPTLSELDDTVKQLESATGSVVVGWIGRTVILYRPSLTKLKAEEKKEQMRKILLKCKKRYSRP